ncbi:P-loop containing nucleoside triphosphate hydrolase protein [Mycena rebaudengoi]|nr:P-loop containing nucleoside triphosphate hydrolase protein [Mycena rebaudengoi]
MASRNTSGSPSRRYVFNFIITGDAAVGKSSLLVRLTNQRFLANLDPTLRSPLLPASPTSLTLLSAQLDVEFGSKLITLHPDGTVVKLQCWDTVGTESFRSITRSYYRGAAGWLLVYDVSSRRSFENIKMWFGDVREHANELRVDESNRDVPTADAVRFAEADGLLFKEANVKSGDGVEDAFVRVSRQGQSPGVKLSTPSAAPAAQTEGGLLLESRRDVITLFFSVCLSVCRTPVLTSSTISVSLTPRIFSTSTFSTPPSSKPSHEPSRPDCPHQHRNHQQNHQHPHHHRASSPCIRVARRRTDPPLAALAAGSTACAPGFSHRAPSGLPQRRAPNLPTPTTTTPPRPRSSLNLSSLPRRETNPCLPPHSNVSQLQQRYPRASRALPRSIIALMPAHNLDAGPPLFGPFIGAFPSTSLKRPLPSRGQSMRAREWRISLGIMCGLQTRHDLGTATVLILFLSLIPFLRWLLRPSISAVAAYDPLLVVPASTCRALERRILALTRDHLSGRLSRDYAGESSSCIYNRLVNWYPRRAVPRLLAALSRDC